MARYLYADGQAVEVGDTILFDHFGGKDRRGRVVKLTDTKIHVEWTAPASGTTRVVPLSTKVRDVAYWRSDVAAAQCEWGYKRPRLVARQEAK